MLEPKVLKVEQQTRIAPAGGSHEVMRVMFMVGEHGPFFVDLEKVRFTPENVKAEMENTVRTISAL